ncbi:MAG: hypothetical protein IT432_13400 [Phycisphaerales bacterium]|nr:hypothetical protein [Phycisphaerales bacterium]
MQPAANSMGRRDEQVARASLSSVTRRVIRSLASAAAALLIVLSLPACASGPAHLQGESSTLAFEDITDTAREMAEKLAASDFLKDRTAASPPVTITLSKVVNYTSDVIRDSERWYLMYRVLDSLPLRELRTSKNIKVVIPRERLEDLRIAAGDPDLPPLGEQREPTHVMDATFRSVTYQAGKARTDAYYCQYRITNIRSGEVAWSDGFEFKRSALGRMID